MGGGWCRNKNTDLNWLDSSKGFFDMSTSEN